MVQFVVNQDVPLLSSSLKEEGFIDKLREMAEELESDKILVSVERINKPKQGKKLAFVKKGKGEAKQPIPNNIDDIFGVKPQETKSSVPEVDIFSSSPAVEESNKETEGEKAGKFSFVKKTEKKNNLTDDIFGSSEATEEKPNKFNFVKKEENKPEGKFSFAKKEESKKFNFVKKEENKPKGKFSFVKKEESKPEGKFNFVKKEENKPEASNNSIDDVFSSQNNDFGNIFSPEVKPQVDINKLNEEYMQSFEPQRPSDNYAFNQPMNVFPNEIHYSPAQISVNQPEPKKDDKFAALAKMVMKKK